MLDGIQSVGSPVSHRGAITVEHAGTSAPAPVSADEPQKSAATTAIYHSPAVQIDHEANMAIFVVRNSETGAVINQYPSKKVVEEYKRADAKRTEEIRSHSQAAAQPTSEAKAEKPQTVVADVKPVVVETKPAVVEDKPVQTVKETA